MQELREAIRPLLDQLNDRSFKKIAGSRRSQFEAIDRPALKPLPPDRYEFFELKKVLVNFDYHVEFDQHAYSVPYQLVGKVVELRATTNSVEVLHGGKRVASHVRSYERPGASTLDQHRPVSHREYANRSPEKLLAWASRIGPSTRQVIELVFEKVPHFDQAHSRALGILKLSKEHGEQRLESACHRGLATGALSYRSIKSILDHGLESRPLPNANAPQLKIVHQNIRGSSYFS